MPFIMYSVLQIHINPEKKHEKTHRNDFIRRTYHCAPTVGPYPWDSGRRTLEQSGSFLQYDYYHVNRPIILAYCLIVSRAFISAAVD